MKAYQIVDADFVKREIGRMPIVDVRPPLRYDTAHIPSAINIRLDVAAASDDPAEELAEMFQDNGIFPLFISINTAIDLSRGGIKDPVWRNNGGGSVTASSPLKESARLP